MNKLFVLLLLFCNLSTYAQIEFCKNPEDYEKYIGRKLELTYMKKLVYVDRDSTFVLPHEEFGSLPWVKSTFGDYNDLNDENKKVYNEKKEKYDSQYVITSSRYKPVLTYQKLMGGKRSPKVVSDSSILNKVFTIVEIKGKSLDHKSYQPLSELSSRRLYLRFRLKDEHGTDIYWETKTRDFTSENVRRKYKKDRLCGFKML